MIGLCALAQDAIGQAATVVTGLVASANSPPSLIINLSAGDIYELAAVDAAVYGSLAADASQILQQGFYAGGSVTLSTAGISAGQGRWALIEATFTQADSIPADDPNEGVLPYINVANPSVPYEGPGNSGNPQNTLRSGICTITVKYGAAATSGSEVPPAADAGYVPLYLIDLDFGQTAVTNGEILVASPQAYSGYPNAPFFPGVTGQIPNASAGSHHGGIAGQAQKIVLTNGAEVQGLLGFGNLPVSNATPPTVGAGGIVTVAGSIPILSIGAGSPNGVLAGNAEDEYFDTIQKVLWICITSGSSSTAVWDQVGSGGVIQYCNSNTNVTPANICFLVDTTSGPISMQLPATATMGGTSAGFKNIGPNVMIIIPFTGQKLEGPNGILLAASASQTFNTQGQMVRYWPYNGAWYAEA